MPGDLCTELGVRVGASYSEGATLFIGDCITELVQIGCWVPKVPNNRSPSQQGHSKR